MATAVQGTQQCISAGIGVKVKPDRGIEVKPTSPKGPNHSCAQYQTPQQRRHQVIIRPQNVLCCLQTRPLLSAYTHLIGSCASLESLLCSDIGRSDSYTYMTGQLLTSIQTCMDACRTQMTAF